MGLAAVFLVAVAVRLIWVTWVQPPSEAVFSDMRNYVDRGLIAIGHKDIAERKLYALALWPYGAHSWYGALIGVFGPPDWACTLDRELGWTGGDLRWVDRAHAVTAALVAPFTYLASFEVTRRWKVALAAGLGVALWPQLITYTGFYSSEVPYSICIAATLWLGARVGRTGRGAAALGVAMAVGATMRPVILLTAVLVVPWLAWRHWTDRRQLARQVVLFCLPLALMAGASSWRFHEYTGRWGLLSANGAMAQLFAITDYKTIGNHPESGFNPPARGRGYKGHYYFRGKITDEAPLKAETRRVWASLTWAERNHYLHRNVGLLFHSNELWPERNAVRYAKNARTPAPERNQWRRDALPAYNQLAWVLLLLACLGSVRGAHQRSAGVELALLHVFALVYAAAFYYGELRYRVPYDPVFFVLATGLASKGPPDRVRAALVALAIATLAIWLALPF